MRFTLKQLAYFDAARRTGSIARAAAAMHISQSSITAAIDAMEHTLGQQLFRRIPAKGLRPTEAGLAAGARIGEFLEEARRLEGDLMTLAGAPAGQLRLGVLGRIASLVLPELLTRLRAEERGIDISLMAGDGPALMEALDRGGLDAALVFRHGLPDGLPFTELARVTPCLLRRKPDGAPPAPPRIEDLAGAHLLLLDAPETAALQLSLATLAKPPEVEQIADMNLIMALVAAGRGLALLDIAPSGLPEGILAQSVVGMPEAPLGLAQMRGPIRPALAERLEQIARELAEEGRFDCEPHKAPPPADPA